MNKIKKEKGFTLIELMVVISIIGLLSSIVLVSIKDARDKAGSTKFRSEVYQLISALEMYRNDNQKYPYENEPSMSGDGSAYYYHINNDRVEYSGNTPLSGILSRYMKKMPYIPNNSYPDISSNSYPSSIEPVFSYYPKLDSLSNRRCKGDLTVPKYVILIKQSNPMLYNAFLDWPNLEILSGGTWSESSFSKCFSLK